MPRRRRRRDSKRKRTRPQGQSGSGRTEGERTPFLETPAGRLVMIALAIIGLWLVILAVYIAGR